MGIGATVLELGFVVILAFIFVNKYKKSGEEFTIGKWTKMIILSLILIIIFRLIVGIL